MSDVVVHGPTIIDAGDEPPRRQPQAVPQPTEAVQAAPRSVVTQAEPLLPVPTPTDEKPVAQTAAEQPVDMPAPMPVPPSPSRTTAEPAAAPATAVASAELPMPAPTAPVSPSAPPAAESAPAAREPNAHVEPNLFDRYGDEVEMPAEGSADAAAAEDPFAAPVDEADAPAANDETEMDETEMKDADAPAPVEAPAAEEESAPEEPAVETAEDATAGTASPADDETSATPRAAAEMLSTVVQGEPLRRWTDATATHHARGWLEEIAADRVRILKVNGRRTTIAIEALSAADREYVSAVVTRLAAEVEVRPAATATARR